MEFTLGRGAVRTIRLRALAVLTSAFAFVGSIYCDTILNIITYRKLNLTETQSVALISLLFCSVLMFGFCAGVESLIRKRSILRIEEGGVLFRRFPDEAIYIRWEDILRITKRVDENNRTVAIEIEVPLQELRIAGFESPEQIFETIKIHIQNQEVFSCVLTRRFSTIGRQLPLLALPVICGLLGCGMRALTKSHTPILLSLLPLMLALFAVLHGLMLLCRHGLAGSSIQESSSQLLHGIGEVILGLLFGFAYFLMIV